MSIRVMLAVVAGSALFTGITRGRQRMASLILIVLALLSFINRTAFAEDPENLVPNRGFEAPLDSEGRPPDGWGFFSTEDKIRFLGVTGRDRRTGTQSLLMEALDSKGNSQGVFLDLAVQAGERYTFTAYVKNNPDNPLKCTAEGQLVMEWLDNSGTEISRSASRKWGRTLSKIRWTCISIRKEKAPPGAARLRIGVQLIDGEHGGQGAFFVDDVSVTR